MCVFYIKYMYFMDIRHETRINVHVYMHCFCLISVSCFYRKFGEMLNPPPPPTHTQSPQSTTFVKKRKRKQKNDREGRKKCSEFQRYQVL